MINATPAESVAVDDSELEVEFLVKEEVFEEEEVLEVEADVLEVEVGVSTLEASLLDDVGEFEEVVVVEVLVDAGDGDESFGQWVKV